MSRSKNLQDDCAQFETIKNRMLLDLQNGIDFSPKGSIDVPIRPIVDLINDIDSLVTTSSCSGRISIFRNDSSIGAKGINWLMVTTLSLPVSSSLSCLLPSFLSSFFPSFFPSFPHLFLQFILPSIYFICTPILLFSLF